jgi:hypothetical protein
MVVRACSAASDSLGRPACVFIIMIKEHLAYILRSLGSSCTAAEAKGSLQGRHPREQTSSPVNNVDH